MSMSEVAKNCNAQFISRNTNEIGRLLIAFRETNQCYDYNLILSLDGDYWIINDSRVGRDLVKFPFKHWKDFIVWCVTFQRDICNLIWMRAKIRRGRNVKQEESWSLKRMQNIFTTEELDYFIKISDNKLSKNYGKEETNH